jgi:hypothetical protein
MGPLLQPHTQQLCGVDVSQGMVQKAQERRCYDQLAVDELVHYLAEAAAAVQQKGGWQLQLPASKPQWCCAGMSDRASAAAGCG